MDYVRIKNFCSLRDTIKKVKRQRTEWKKIFVIYIELIFRIYRDHLKFNKKENQVEKWAKDLNRQFTKRVSK